jgi:hypothetical protein
MILMRMVLLQTLWNLFLKMGRVGINYLRVSNNINYQLSNAPCMYVLKQISRLSESACTDGNISGKQLNLNVKLIYMYCTIHALI